jgi:hypothetical protein
MIELSLDGANDALKPPGQTLVNPFPLPGADQSNPSAQDILDAIKYDPQLNKDGDYTGADLDDLGTLLYKIETDPLGGGGTLFTYSTTNAGADAILTYNGGLDLTKPLWVVVKDGTSGFVVWDLLTFGDQGVDWGTADGDGVQVGDQLEFISTNIFFTQQFDKDGIPELDDEGNPIFKPKEDAISNIQIWGSLDPTDPSVGLVPEPSSIALLLVGAVGMIGFGYRRRKSEVAA